MLKKKILGVEKSLGIERCESLEEILNLSDCISLHCSLTNETNFLINGDTLHKIKYGAFLVNTAASELVLNTALLNGLKSGRIRAAALDIYDKDPNNSVISGLKKKKKSFYKIFLLSLKLDAAGIFLNNKAKKTFFYTLL